MLHLPLKHLVMLQVHLDFNDPIYIIDSIVIKKLLTQTKTEKRVHYYLKIINRERFKEFVNNENFMFH